jgi:hypothetical protein
VPVDRVVEGILAALPRAEAIGGRIHLATDNRIRLGGHGPHHARGAGRERAAGRPDALPQRDAARGEGALERVGSPSWPAPSRSWGTIFGGYGEWGQPIHDVGNDVRILGLPLRRPQTDHAFRMLCRHNRYVQEYGRVRERRRGGAP